MLLPFDASKGVDRSSDLLTIQRALGGDQTAREQIFDRLSCVARALSRRNLRMGRPFDSQELEDLAQDTLIAVWRKLSVFDGRAPLEAWVHRFCFLEFMRALRDRSRSPELRSDIAHLDIRLDEGEPSLVDIEAVQIELQALEQEEAHVLQLKHFEHHTFDQIGTLLDLSPNTVKAKYYRALGRLRERLSRRGTLRGEQ